MEMRKVGARRRTTPLHRPVHTPPPSGTIQQLLIVIALLSTIVLVLFTLPHNSDSSTEQTVRFARKRLEDHDNNVKGVVVSHGFLRINVNVAYKKKSDGEPKVVSKQDTPKPLKPDELHGKQPRERQTKKQKVLNETTILPTIFTRSPSTLLAKSDEQSQPRPPPLPSPPSIIPEEEPVRPNATLRPTFIKISDPALQVSKEEIVIDIVFHRVQSPEPESLLTCRLPEDAIASALETAAKIWRTQAKIILRYTDQALRWENVSADVEFSFKEHLARFPRNDDSGQPWTTENPGRIGLVGNDLIQMLSIDTIDRWSTVNPINVFCIGAFVGYNGVTWSRHVFIRSIQYHKTDKDMDTETFTRILAHEIGHVLSLPHPGAEFCSLPCDTSLCNLMCQQRALPRNIDARFARAMTSLQVSRARTAAALVDSMSTAHFLPGAKIYGVSTHSLPNTRASKSQLFFLSQPLSPNATVTISRIAMMVTRLKSSCTVGLVLGKSINDVFSARLRAAGTLLPGSTSMIPRDGASQLIFEELDPTWWTSARHVEAEVSPPLDVPANVHVGLAFSCNTLSLQLIRRPGYEYNHVPKISTTLFSSTKASFSELKTEHVIGSAPIFNVVVA